jgi:3-dehydroquinate dehydratase-2
VKVLVIHGPSLDRLGVRDPDHYGSQTLDEVNAHIEKVAGELGMTVEIHQSAIEGEIVGLLNEAAGRIAGAVVNPAAYSHTSRAIADAIAAVDYPVIEVHLSNIHAREQFRHHSVVSAVAAGVICGLGVDGYRLALQHLATRAAARPD